MLPASEIREGDATVLLPDAQCRCIAKVYGRFRWLSVAAFFSGLFAVRRGGARAVGSDAATILPQTVVGRWRWSLGSLNFSHLKNRSSINGHYGIGNIKTNWKKNSLGTTGPTLLLVSMLVPPLPSPRCPKNFGQTAGFAACGVAIMRSWCLDHGLYRLRMWQAMQPHCILEIPPTDMPCHEERRYLSEGNKKANDRTTSGKLSRSTRFDHRARRRHRGGFVWLYVSR